MGSLQSHELRRKQYDSSPLEQAFQTQVSLRGGFGSGKGRGSSRGRGRNNESSGHSQKDESQSYNGGRGHGVRQQEGEKNSTHSSSSTRGRGKGWPSLKNIQCHYCEKFVISRNIARKGLRMKRRIIPVLCMKEIKRKKPKPILCFSHTVKQMLSLVKYGSVDFSQRRRQRTAHVAAIRTLHRTIQSVGATGGVYKGQGRS
ncbi:hypothetical protein Vadar_029038 [Vaccinium darrowii]|uniref:Uncharacterized protein n=1 Tax=Vaccinium darrowii TaxID=229202 RepID=A0ACB7XCV8_9ERIC|nr:hypothetical protein Vadar_029038 [Vaccinium darrowii]